MYILHWSWFQKAQYTWAYTGLTTFYHHHHINDGILSIKDSHHNHYRRNPSMCGHVIVGMRLCWLTAMVMMVMMSHHWWHWWWRWPKWWPWWWPVSDGAARDDDRVGGAPWIHFNRHLPYLPSPAMRRALNDHRHCRVSLVSVFFWLLLFSLMFSLNI